MSQILLHIGFPKAGSTYLQKWFEKHPDIYFQPKYMAEGFIHAWHLAWYIQQAESVPQNFVVSCEDLTLWQSHPYMYGLRGTEPYDYKKFRDQMCEVLKGLYPTAKVLIVTRGYEALFTSIYSQYLAMTGTFTFSEMIENHKEMFATMLDYSYVIDLYRKAFGNDRVLLLPYELLRDEPAKFLGLIEQYLCIKEHFELPGGRLNAAYDQKTLAAYRKFSFFVYRVLKPFPNSWRVNLYKLYTYLIRLKKPHPLLVWMARFVKQENSMDGMEAMLNAMKGTAEVLRDETLFQPYLKEYLLE